MIQRISITTTVIANIDCGATDEGSVDWNIALHGSISPLVESIRTAVAASIRGYPDTVYSGSVDFGYLDDQSNLHVCKQCNRLFTDREKADQIPGMPIGRSVGGRLLCSECEMFPRTQLTSH